MATVAYARSDSPVMNLPVQLTGQRKAGCSDIAIDRTHRRHPRDLRRRAALIERLQRGDKVMVCRLDCLVVSAVDLVTTIARIRSRNAVLLTADPDGPSSFCNDTIDAISSAFATFANRMPERDDSAPLLVGRSVILSSSDWPRIQKDCADPSATAVAKRHSVSRSALYNFSDRMRQGTGIAANVEKDAP